MKIRQGFVSNSSSSSFIIALKNGKTLDDLTPEMLGVQKGSALYPMAEGIVSLFKDAERQKNNRSDHWEWDRVQNLVAKGYEVYVGSASSEADSAYEQAMVELSFNYNNDDIIIEKDAGY